MNRTRTFPSSASEDEVAGQNDGQGESSVHAIPEHLVTAGLVLPSCKAEMPAPFLPAPSPSPLHPLLLSLILPLFLPFILSLTFSPTSLSSSIFKLWVNKKHWHSHAQGFLTLENCRLSTNICFIYALQFIYFHPNLQKQGDLSVNVTSTGFYSFFEKLQLYQQASDQDVCCTNRKLNGAPEECRHFLELQSVSSIPCVEVVSICDSQCVTTSASLPRCTAPLSKRLPTLYHQL